MNRKMKEKLDLQNMKLGNCITRKTRLINEYIKRWPFLFYTISMFIILIILTIFFIYDYLHPIDQLATWVGSFGTIFAALVALYLSRKQPKMKIGTDLLISKDYVIASFLNRRKSDGFIRADKLHLYAKEENGSYLNIMDIPKSYQNLFYSDWQRWRSVSSTKPLELYLYNKKYNYNSFQVLYKFLTGIYIECREIEKFKNHPLDTCIFVIDFVSNDYSSDISIHIPIFDLKYNKIILEEDDNN